MVERRSARWLSFVGALVATLFITSWTPAWAQDAAQAASDTAVATATNDDATKDDASSAESAADESAQPTEKRNRSLDFLRIRTDDDGKPVSMETSVTRYAGKDMDGNEIVVDLIGAVHIGEQEYYEALNEHFEQYDVLLYELVAPEGTRIPRGGVREDGFNPLSGLQTMMGSMLELDFQLEHIDYTKNNFVHADMSPEEFSESMANNDESLLKLFFKILGHSMAAQSADGPSDLEVIRAYLAPDRAMRMRRLMAAQMKNMEAAMSIFEGEDGSTIITHRNSKALDVMKREIAKGHRRIGIFYGAGHLPDMEDRLLEDHDMRAKERAWFVAWKMKKGSMEIGPLKDEEFKPESEAGETTEESSDDE